MADLPLVGLRPRRNCAPTKTKTISETEQLLHIEQPDYRASRVWGIPAWRKGRLVFLRYGLQEYHAGVWCTFARYETSEEAERALSYIRWNTGTH